MEYVANTSGWRQSIENFIGHTKVQHTLVVLIVVNALILGLETSQNIMAVAGYELHLIDQIILWIFIGELALLMTARGFRFFKDPWCVFDLIVIGSSNPRGTFLPIFVEFSNLQSERPRARLCS